jgi:hypothetical protein
VSGLSPPPSDPSPSPEPDRLAEYETLDREVRQRRLLGTQIFIGATLIVLVLIGATLVLGPADPETQTVRLALIYAAHGVVVAALFATHRLTHRIDFTAGYLRTIVEPQVVAETGAPVSSRRRLRALESSRALGGCYALLISAIVAAGILNGLYRTMWAVGLPVLALVGVINANLLFMSEPARRPRGGDVPREVGPP